MSGFTDIREAESLLSFGDVPACKCRNYSFRRPRPIPTICVHCPLPWHRE
jgi:hypothetical protein